MAKIGIGTTVWASGEKLGHLDGIGVYSRSLWLELQKLSGGRDRLFETRPYAFGRSFPDMVCGYPTQLGSKFSLHALSCAIFGSSFGLSGVKKEIDLFHATDHYIPSIPNVPVVATLMDVIPFVHPEWASQGLRCLKNFIFERSIRSAQHIITISEFSKSDIVNIFDINPNNISVTYLGVDSAYFDRVPPSLINSTLEKHNLSKGFFLFVGTLQPRKNLSRVISAYNSLPKEVRVQRKLVVVGRDGWGNRELLLKLESLELLGEVLWLKYLPKSEVVALLQSAAALVFPSLYEGFGLPVLEAFASRCPVITSNTTSLPEVAGDAAWLVDPHDTDSIALAMQDVLVINDRSVRKVEKGLSRAKYFTWQACAEQTCSVYQKVIGG